VETIPLAVYFAFGNAASSLFIKSFSYAFGNPASSLSTKAVYIAFGNPASSLSTKAVYFAFGNPASSLSTKAVYFAFGNPASSLSTKAVYFASGNPASSLSTKAVYIAFGNAASSPDAMRRSLQGQSVNLDGMKQQGVDGCNARQTNFLVGAGSAEQGCQMVCFQTKNPKLGKFGRVLQWKMLVYFMDIWSCSW
jgi:hypothetical protein